VAVVSEFPPPSSRPRSLARHGSAILPSRMRATPSRRLTSGR